MKTFFKNLLASILGSIIGFSIVLVIFFIICIGVLVSSMSLTNKNTAIISGNSVLLVKFDKPISDRASDNPLAGFDFGDFSSLNAPGLDKILISIQKAKTDSRIKGIYMELSTMPAGIAVVEEIRNALVDFKSSGKFIIAYSEAYTQKSFYLASIADSLYLNPEGDFDFKGLSGQVSFFKGTLDKLGIDMQVIRHGKYKSAVEPFTSDKMSEANKEQTLTYVTGIWKTMLTSISQYRNVQPEILENIADSLLAQSAVDALKYKLVDKLLFKDEILSVLKKNIGIEEKQNINFVSLEKYITDLKPLDLKMRGKDKIAVIYASGSIESGEGNENTIGSEKISRAIRSARSDSSVKAVVFRINSPGGSALASEVIWREINLTKKTKPVVVSMGDYAASGGYYIACPANKIFAQSTTLTGSIGVFGLIPNMQKFFSDKLGVTFDNVNTNKHSDYISAVRAMDPYEQLVLLNMIERIYSTFINHVAEGRNISIAHVDSIGQGRVWNGIDAKRIGLIDEIGGLNDAIKSASEIAGLTEYAILPLPEQKDPFTQIIEQLTGDVPVALLEKTLGESYIWYKHINEVKKMEGVQARLPFDIAIY